jgi:hypothetical protein
MFNQPGRRSRGSIWGRAKFACGPHTECADGLRAEAIGGITFPAPTTQLETMDVSFYRGRGRVEDCAFVDFRSGTLLWRRFT